MLWTLLRPKKNLKIPQILRILLKWWHYKLWEYRPRLFLCSPDAYDSWINRVYCLTFTLLVSPATTNVCLESGKKIAHTLYLFTGEASSMKSDQLKKKVKRFPDDTEMGVDALEASCIIGPKKGEGATARNQDGLKGQYTINVVQHLTLWNWRNCLNPIFLASLTENLGFNMYRLFCWESFSTYPLSATSLTLCLSVILSVGLELIRCFNKCLLLTSLG